MSKRSSLWAPGKSPVRGDVFFLKVLGDDQPEGPETPLPSASSHCTGEYCSTPLIVRYMAVSPRVQPVNRTPCGHTKRMRPVRNDQEQHQVSVQRAQRQGGGVRCGRLSQTGHRQAVPLQRAGVRCHDTAATTAAATAAAAFSCSRGSSRKPLSRKPPSPPYCLGWLFNSLPFIKGAFLKQSMITDNNVLWSKNFHS